MLVMLEDDRNQRKHAPLKHLTPRNALSIMSKRQLRDGNVLPCAFVYFPVRNSPLRNRKDIQSYDL